MTNEIKENLLLKDCNFIEDSIEDEICWTLFEKNKFTVVDIKECNSDITKLSFKKTIYSSLEIYINLKDKINTKIKCAFLCVNDNIKNLNSEVIKDLDYIYTSLLPTEVFNKCNYITINELKKIRTLPNGNKDISENKTSNGGTLYIYNDKTNEEQVLKKLLTNTDLHYLYKIKYDSNFNRICEFINDKKIHKLILDDIPLRFYYKIKLYFKDSLSIKFANISNIPSIERTLFEDSSEVSYLYNNLNKFKKVSIREYFNFIFSKFPNFDISSHNSPKHDISTLLDNLNNPNMDYLDFVFDQQNLNHRNATKYLFLNTKLNYYFMGYFYLLKKIKNRKLDDLELLFKFSLKYFCDHYPPLGYLYCNSITELNESIFLLCLFRYIKTSKEHESSKLKYLSTQILITHTSVHENIDKVSSHPDVIPTCQLISRIIKKGNCNDFDKLFDGFKQDDIDYTIFRLIENNRLGVYFSLNELLYYISQKASESYSFLRKLNIILIGINIHKNDFNFVINNSKCIYQKKILDSGFHFINYLLHQISIKEKFDEDYIHSSLTFFHHSNPLDLISLLCLSLVTKNLNFIDANFHKFSFEMFKKFYDSSFIPPYYKFLYIEILCSCFFKEQDLSEFSCLRSFINNEMFNQHKYLINTVISFDFTPFSFHNHFNSILSRYFNN